MCIVLCQVQYILKCGIQFKDGTEMNETLEKGRDDGWRGGTSVLQGVNSKPKDQRRVYKFS